jgi:hypothetical protein
MKIVIIVLLIILAFSGYKAFTSPPVSPVLAQSPPAAAQTQRAAPETNGYIIEIIEEE